VEQRAGALVCICVLPQHHLSPIMFKARSQRHRTSPLHLEPKMAITFELRPKVVKISFLETVSDRHCWGTEMANPRRFEHSSALVVTIGMSTQSCAAGARLPGRAGRFRQLPVREPDRPARRRCGHWHPGAAGSGAQPTVTSVPMSASHRHLHLNHCTQAAYPCRRLRWWLSPSMAWRWIGCRTGAVILMSMTKSWPHVLTVLRTMQQHEAGHMQAQAYDDPSSKTWTVTLVITLTQYPNLTHERYPKAVLRAGSADRRRGRREGHVCGQCAGGADGGPERAAGGHPQPGVRQGGRLAGAQTHRGQEPQPALHEGAPHPAATCAH